MEGADVAASSQLSERPDWKLDSLDRWGLLWEMSQEYNCWLVVWLPSIYFPINIGNLIIPIDELIFFRGVAEPLTR